MSTKTIERLNALVADYQLFYQKLRSYHWNVTGPLFFGLHAKFEELYRDAADKVDQLAERVAALGARPTGTLKQVLATARLQESEEIPGAAGMVEDLVSDLGNLNGWLRESSATATELGDVTTANLLDGFVEGQEKTAWMLRAFLQS